MDHEPSIQTYIPDDELDRLADIGSYDEARRMRGIPSAEGEPSTQLTWAEREADKYKPKRMLSTAQRRRTGRAAVGPQYGDDAGVGYPGGKPPEHQNFSLPTKEQAERNHDHISDSNWRTRGAEYAQEAANLRDELDELDRDLIDATGDDNDIQKLEDRRLEVVARLRQLGTENEDE